MKEMPFIFSAQFSKLAERYCKMYAYNVVDVKKCVVVMVARLTNHKHQL